MRALIAGLLFLVAGSAAASDNWSGLWVDRTTAYGERYCVVKAGYFGPRSGTQTFVFCSSGFGVGGSAVVQQTFPYGQIDLYRLQSENGYLVPTFVLGARTLAYDGNTWTVTFSATGVPAYTLTKDWAGSFFAKPFDR